MIEFEVKLGAANQKHWAHQQQHADLVGHNRVPRKGHDTRYNCFGLCFAGGLGWVGVDPDLDFTIPSLLTLTRPPQPVRKFDARQLLVANGWILLVKESLQTLAPSADKLDKVLPGDIALYSRPGGLPEHAGLIVAAAPNELPYLRILSKLGAGGEWIHNIGDPMIVDQCGTEFEIWGDRQG